MANFVTGFHNLEGDLVNERKKSFFKLLKTTSLNSSESEIDNALKNIQPKTYQERLFWVETLIFFKKTEALLEILKEGNIEHIKIIIRQKWFIEEAFKNTSPVEFVNDFLPCVSYSTRLKILRKISCCWSEDKMDQLFDAIQKRYGIFNAFVLIHSCSFSKIVHLLGLQDYDIKLSNYQIQHILLKNDEIFSIYIDHIFNLVQKPFTEKNILNLLAIKNPNLFLKQFKSKKIKIKKLTTAATSQILHFAKDEIIRDPHIYVRIMNKRTILKCLATDFKIFYKNLFSRENWSDKMDDILQYLKYFPKSKRWELFRETFFSCFPNITEEEIFELTDILILNPSPDVKMKWAEIKLKISKDEKFLNYYTTSVGVPLIKEKINLCSDITRRVSLLKSLVLICAENKDLNSLSSVLEYLSDRHQNEYYQIYLRILETVCNTFIIDDLRRDHCCFLREQALLLKARGVEFYEYSFILIKVLTYSYKYDKKLFELTAIDYLKFKLGYHYRIYLDDQELERNIFFEFCKLFPYVSNPEEDIQTYGCNDHILVSDFFEICEITPKNCLNILHLPYLLSVIETIYTKTKFEDEEVSIISKSIEYHLDYPQYSLPFLNEAKIIELLSLTENKYHVIDEIIIFMSRKKVLSQLEYNILLKLLEMPNVSLHFSNITYFIPNHPRLFMLYFDNFLNKDILTRRSTRKYKYYSHLGIDKKICDYVEKGWNKFTINYKQITLGVLIDLLPETEFIQFVNKNVFKTNEELSIILNLQKKVFQLLKSVSKAELFVPFIIDIYTEDNSKYSTPSVCRLFSKTSEKLLYPYFNNLLRKNVTLYISLTCALLDEVRIFNLLYSNDTKFKRNQLLRASLQYFKNNPSEDLYSIIIKRIQDISSGDQIMIMFKKLSFITLGRKYRQRYIEIFWNLLEKYKDEEIKLKSYFDKLLHQTLDDNVITSLSSGFVNNILKNYLSVEDKNRLNDIDQFAIQCITYREQDRRNNIKTVLEILFKLDKMYFKTFCNNLIDFVCSKKPGFNIIQQILQHLNDNPCLPSSLEQRIILNIVNTYLSATFEDFAKFIVDYFDQLTTDFGPCIYNIFRNSLEQQIDKLDKYCQYKLFNFMLNYKLSSAICVLVIELIPLTSTDDPEDLKSAFDNIVVFLKKSEDTLVQYYFENHLQLKTAKNKYLEDSDDDSDDDMGFGLFD